MSSSEEQSEKIQELSRRVALVENLLSKPVVTSKDMKVIIIAMVVTAFAATLALTAEMYIIYQVGKLYALLNSI